MRMVTAAGREWFCNRRCRPLLVHFGTILLHFFMAIPLFKNATS
jgi:hypothetical protein